ncbi:hypothetical protein RFI_32560 [Reticulomyxa filosa]|uniref:Uncharacterized protein n=1 Tax=Reticulomyxa filosa TaxID=46433 RepID=X6LTY9_RETFI|nr:hypothetical protein RFI_32560 [Reticulomyxa filosa]|eukprot:ETO04836.1 hypothetical protein RFI_32560 [Reticulomyxa filosa]
MTWKKSVSLKKNSNCLFIQMYRSHQVQYIAVDVTWIFPFKYEREILFARSKMFPTEDEKAHKQQIAWIVKINKTINLWNVESDKMLKQFKRHSDRVMVNLLFLVHWMIQFEYGILKQEQNGIY